jgi:hypothetical protein
MSPDIVFEDGKVEYLLDLFDKVEDEDGYVFDPETGQRVTPDDSDRPIRTDELGVVGRGSEIFVKDEVDSIVEFVNGQHETDE